MTKKKYLPFFSIITINFNNYGGLKNTIKSVDDQNYKSYEHIIIDGLSNDGSERYLKKFIDKKKILIEKDKGVFDAMNKGISMSRGKYLIFLNSGDFFFEKESLQILNRTISRFTKKTREHKIFFGKARIKGKYFEWNQPARYFVEDDFLPVHQAMCIPKKKIKKYDDTYKIAADELFKLSNKNNLIFLRFIFIVYQYGGMSSSINFFDFINRTKEQIKIRLKLKMYNSLVKIFFLNIFKYLTSFLGFNYFVEFLIKFRNEN
tara:strand:+ start:121 stop:906 length:786 start_codon:yes stop_codon:yes gene_type:complete